MRALAVREAYATLIARGRKTIETRTWATSWRGPLVVIASSSVDLDSCRRYRVTPQPSTLAALVELVDVRPFRPSDVRRACMRPVDEWHVDDFFSWILADARPLRRAPFTGSKLGVFKLPPRTMVRVAR